MNLYIFVTTIKLMKYRLVKLKDLSGNQASIYSIYLIDEKITLFKKFLIENKNIYKSELNDIFSRLIAIGHSVGAREQFFKKNEGVPGDGVCALYDKIESKLRLYCIRYGSLLVILGGGGFKSKDIKAFQDNEKLAQENSILRQISKEITERMITEKEIKFSFDYMDFEGNLEFNDEDYE